MARPFIAFYLKTSDWLSDRGLDKTLAVCRRAQAAGYNGVLCWDNMAQRPNPEPAYPLARQFQAGLAGLGMDYAVQVATLGEMTADAIGDRSILETNGDGEPECCLADPRVHDLWRRQAAIVMDYWPDPRFLLLGYDEIRRGGDPDHTACRPWVGRYGELLAAHAQEAIAYHRQITGRTVAVWSDMFDPYENAAAGNYHGVRGGFPGSWKGLDPAVLVVNWNTNSGGGVLDGFRHFAGLGCRQLYAGYYDPGTGDDGLSPGAEHRLEGQAIEAAGQVGIAGYVYTTWPNEQHPYGKYSDLKAYAPGPGLIGRMVPLDAGAAP